MSGNVIGTPKVARALCTELSLFKPNHMIRRRQRQSPRHHRQVSHLIAVIMNYVQETQQVSFLTEIITYAK